MITILAFIVILGVLIFVHELGHFATAKWANIAVPRFSIGLGPKMVGFTRGETEYVISWLPLGGYVRMAGMDDMEALEGGAHDSTEAEFAGRDFESKSLPVRAVVLAAGVVMNMLFAWLVFSIIAMGWGVRETPDAVVGDVIEEMVPEGAAPLLDIPRGARIVAVNGQAVADWSDVQRRMSMPRDSVRLTLQGHGVVAVPVPGNDSARAGLIFSLEPLTTVTPLIGEVSDQSPASVAGVRPGDQVVAAAGEEVATWQEFVAAVEANPGRSIPLTVQRDGQRLELTVVPEARAVASDPDRQVGRIGVGRSPVAGDAFPRERIGPVAAVAHGAQETWAVTAMILDYLAGLFTGRASPRDVGGPILIYQISDQVVQIGFDAFLNFMALFSVNLAILNLLPIPILDGGQLLFLAVEGIRGKPLTVDQRIRLSQFGLVLVVAIMVWAFANDIMRLFGV